MIQGVMSSRSGLRKAVPWLHGAMVRRSPFETPVLEADQDEFDEDLAQILDDIRRTGTLGVQIMVRDRSGDSYERFSTEHRQITGRDYWRYDDAPKLPQRHAEPLYQKWTREAAQALSEALIKRHQSLIDKAARAVEEAERARQNGVRRERELRLWLDSVEASARSDVAAWMRRRQAAEARRQQEALAQKRLDERLAAQAEADRARRANWEKLQAEQRARERAIEAARARFPVEEQLEVVRRLWPAALAETTGEGVRSPVNGVLYTTPEAYAAHLYQHKMLVYVP